MKKVFVYGLSTSLCSMNYVQIGEKNYNIKGFVKERK